MTHKPILRLLAEARIPLVPAVLWLHKYPTRQIFKCLSSIALTVKKWLLGLAACFSKTLVQFDLKFHHWLHYWCTSLIEELTEAVVQRLPLSAFAQEEKNALTITLRYLWWDKSAFRVFARLSLEVRKVTKLFFRWTIPSHFFFIFIFSI